MSWRRVPQPGIYVPGVQRFDCAVEIDNNLTVGTGGVATFSGATNFNGATTVGTINLGVAENQPGPADVGLLGWAYDPLAATTTSLSIAGRVYLVALWVRQPTLLSNAWIQVTTGATGATAGQNFLGLYNSAGTQVAVTADISASLGTTGAKTAAFTTPYSAPSGQYWMGMVFNAATTLPTLASAISASNYGHLNNAAANYRFAVNGSGATALPASITPASNSTTNALTFWTGVS